MRLRLISSLRKWGRHEDECRASRYARFGPGGLFKGWSFELHDLRGQGAAWPHVQVAHGDGEVEAARTAGAGVEVEHAFVVGDGGFVRVPVEDGGEARGRG